MFKKVLTGQPDNIVQVAVLGLQFAQPVGVAATGLQFIVQLCQPVTAAKESGVFAQLFDELACVVAQRDLSCFARQGKLTVKAEATGLEFIEARDMGLLLPVKMRSLEQQPMRQALRQGGQGTGLANAQRRIADPDFDRAEFRLGADIPVKVLDTLHDAALAEKVEMSGKGGPVGEWRALSAERKGGNGIEAGRLEQGVDAVDEG